MSVFTDRLPGLFRRRNRADPPIAQPAAIDPSLAGGASVTTGGGSDSEPVVVWEAANSMEAHVVKGRLESEGIPALIQGEALATIYGLTAGNLATAKVLVPAPLADKAMAILFANETASEADQDAANEVSDEEMINRSEDFTSDAATRD